MAVQKENKQYTAELNLEVNDAQVKLLNSRFQKMVNDFTKIVETDLGIKGFDYLNSTVKQFETVMNKASQIIKENEKAQKQLKKEMLSSGATDFQIANNPRYQAYSDQNRRLENLSYLRSNIANVPSDAKLNKQITQLDKYNQKLSKLVSDVMGISNFDFIEDSSRHADKLQSIIKNISKISEDISNQLDGNNDNKAIKRLENMQKKCEQILPLMEKMNALQTKIETATPHGNTINTGTSGKVDTIEYKEAIQEQKARAQRNQSKYAKQMRALPAEIQGLPNLTLTKDNEKEFAEVQKQFTAMARKVLIQKYKDYYKQFTPDNIEALSKSGAAADKSLSKLFDDWLPSKKASGTGLSIANMKEFLYSLLNELPEDQKLINTSKISVGSHKAKLAMEPVGTVPTSNGDFIKSYQQFTEYVKEVSKEGKEVERAVQQFEPQSTVKISNLKSLTSMGQFLTKDNGKPINYNNRSLYSINEGLEQIRAGEAGKSPEEIAAREQVISNVITDIGELAKIASGKIEEYSVNMDKLTEAQQHELEVYTKFNKQITSEFSDGKLLHVGARNIGGVSNQRPTDFEYFGSEDATPFNDMATGFGQLNTMGTVERELKQRQDAIKAQVDSVKTVMTGQDAVEYAEMVAQLLNSLTGPEFAEGLKNALKNGTAKEYVGTIRSSILDALGADVTGGRELSAGIGYGEGSYGHGVYTNKSGKALIAAEDLDNPENVQRMLEEGAVLEQVTDDLQLEDEAIKRQLAELSNSQKAIVILNTAIDSLSSVMTDYKDTLESIKDKNEAVSYRIAGLGSEKAPKDMAQAINMSANSLSNYVTQGQVILQANRSYAEASGMDYQEALRQNISGYSEEMQLKIKESIALRKQIDELLYNALETFRNDMVSVKPFDAESQILLQEAQEFGDNALIANLRLFYEKVQQFINSKDLQALSDVDKANYNKFASAIENFNNTIVSGISSGIKKTEDKSLNGILSNIEYFKNDYKAFCEFLSKFYSETYDIGGRSFNADQLRPSSGNDFLPQYAGTPKRKTRTPKERFFDNKGYSILATYGVDSFEEAIPLAYSRLDKKQNLLSDSMKEEKQRVLDVIAKYTKDRDKAEATIAEIEEKYAQYLDVTKTGTKIKWSDIPKPDKDFLFGTKLTADSAGKGSAEYSQIQDELSQIYASKEEIEADKKAYKAAKASLTRINKSAKFQDAQEALNDFSQDDQSIIKESAYIEGQIEYMEQIIALKAKRAAEEQKKLETEQQETQIIQNEKEAIQTVSQGIIKNKQEDVQQPDYEALLEYGQDNGALPTRIEGKANINEINTALETHQLDLKSATEAEREKFKVSQELTDQLKKEYDAVILLNEAFHNHVSSVSNATASERKARQQAAQVENELPFDIAEEGYDAFSSKVQRELGESYRAEALENARRPDYAHILDTGNAENVIQSLANNPASERNVIYEQDALAQYSSKLKEQINLLEQAAKVQTMIEANQSRINQLAEINNQSARDEARALVQQNSLLEEQKAGINKLYNESIISKEYTGLQKAIEAGQISSKGVARKKQMDEAAIRNAEEAIVSGRIAGSQKSSEQSLKTQNVLVDNYLKSYEKLSALNVKYIDLVEKGAALEGASKVENDAKLAQVQQQIDIEQAHLELLDEEKLTLNGMVLSATNYMRLRAKTREIDESTQAQIDVNSSKNSNKASAAQNKVNQNNINQYLKTLTRRNSLEQQINRTQKSMGGQTGQVYQDSQALLKNLEAQKMSLDNIIASYDREKGILNGIQLSEQERLRLNDAIDKSQLDQTYTLSRINNMQMKQVSFLDKLVGGFKQQITYLIDMSLAYQAVGKVRQILNEVIQQTVALDESIVDIQIATGMTRQETQELLRTYVQMGDKLGRNAQEIATAANDWLRAGYEGQEAAKLTEASMMLSTLGMIESGEATTYLISTLKGWKLAAEDVIGVVDKLSVIKCSVCLVISIGHKSKCR